MSGLQPSEQGMGITNAAFVIPNTVRNLAGKREEILR